MAGTRLTRMLASVSDRDRAIRIIQARSAPELNERRATAIGLIRAVADLEFVNGGGTGSLESTSADYSVTELAAGLFVPGLGTSSSNRNAQFGLDRMCEFCSMRPLQIASLH